MGNKGVRRQNIWIHLLTWLLCMRTLSFYYLCPSFEVIRQFRKKWLLHRNLHYWTTTYTISPHPTIFPGSAELSYGPILLILWSVYCYENLWKANNMIQHNTNQLQRKITYLSKVVEFYEINESNIGELYQWHFKSLFDIQRSGRVQLTTTEEKSRRRKILNRKC